MSTRKVFIRFRSIIAQETVERHACIFSGRRGSVRMNEEWQVAMSRSGYHRRNGRKRTEARIILRFLRKCIALDIHPSNYRSR